MIKSRRRDAFTVIEVLIASMVLAIALIGLISAFARAAWLNANAKETSMAINGCRKEMDVIRATFFNTIVTTYAPPNDNFPVEGLLAQPGDPDGLPGKVTVTSAGAMLTITCTVSWRGVAGDRQISLASNLVNRR